MAVEVRPQEPPIKVDLTNQVFLLTGASRGIGEAVARGLAANGARLVINARDGQRLWEVARDIDPSGERVLTVTGDIGYGGVTEIRDPDTKQVLREAVPSTGELMTRRAMDQWKVINGAIHAAGVNRDGFFQRTTHEDWDAVRSVKYDGAFYLFQPVYGVMLRQRAGRLVGVTSISGEGNPMQGAYAAANYGVEGLLNSVGAEASVVRRPGIEAHIVRLGAVDSGMIQALQGTKPEAVQSFVDRMEWGRLITKTEAANEIIRAVSGTHPDVNTRLHIFDGGMRR